MNRFLKRIKRLLLPFFVILAYVFLYAPILTLAFFSLNKSSLPHVWGGFSLQWYVKIFQSTEILKVIINSIIISTISSSICLIMLLSLVFYSAEKKIKNLSYIFFPNLMVPEIMLAVSLLTLFTMFSINLGFSTIIIGHILLGFGYTAPIVFSSLAEIDKQLIEASKDLGATSFQTFFKIIIPMLYPALITSALLVFIVSFDDFILSFFCSSATSQTLSLYIFSTLSSGVLPTTAALSIIITLISSMIVLVIYKISSQKIGLLK